MSESFRLKRPTESLVLARWPLVSIEMIIEAGAALAGSDFEAEADKGLICRLAGDGERADWCGNIVIDYQAGYILPGEPGRTLPDDIERAAILLVKTAWFARTRDPLIRSEKTPDVYEAT